MSSTTTIAEMRSMQLPDLAKEVRSHQSLVRKMRMQITMNTDKDTGRYRREKRALARMMMVLTEKQNESLKAKPKTATVRRLRASPSGGKARPVSKDSRPS